MDDLSTDWIWQLAATMAGAIAIVITMFVHQQVSGRRRLRARREEIVAEAEGFAAEAATLGSLPQATTSVILGRGEESFYDDAATLFETTAVRHHESTGVRIRVARGLSVGGTSGRSTSTQEWTAIDTGRLTITSKRLIFDGTRADRSVRLDRILSTNASFEGLEVSAENRQKSMVFGVPNPLVAEMILRACCQARSMAGVSSDRVAAFEE